MPGGTIRLRDPATGEVFEIDEADAPAYLADQWTPETATETAARTARQQVIDDNSGLGDQVQATLGQAANIATLGLSDVGIRVFGGEESAAQHRRVRESNPLATDIGTAGGIIAGLAAGGSGAAGSIAGLTPAGLASRAGMGIARAGEGAGAVTRIVRGAAGAGFEGGLQGAGSAVSELALSPDELSVEHAMGLLKTRTLTGASASLLAGGAASSLEVGLGAAARRLRRTRDAAEQADTTSANLADLADLDGKGLAAAKEAELARIEAERVGLRQGLADDIARYRVATRTEKPWEAIATGNKGKAQAEAAKKLADRATDAEADALALEARATRNAGDPAAAEAAASARAAANAAREAAEDAAAAASVGNAPAWMRALGKRTLKADRVFDNLIDNPKRLARDPKAALDALERQEQALQEILDRADDLAPLHAADRSGRRAAAFARVEPTLQANRALQARIQELAAAPTSARLAAIGEAVTSLGSAPKKTLGQQMASGTVYGMVAGAVGSVPLVGPLMAPILAAKAADAIGGKVGAQLGAAAKQSVDRAVKAADAFVTVARGARQSAGKIAPVLASKVLADTRFGPEAAPDPLAPPRDRRRKPSLDESYRARAAELAAATAPGPDGRPQVRQHARDAIGEQLAPIAAVSPLLADKLETLAVRRLEFLAARMPRTVRMGLTIIPPTELEIRKFARYVAAADDPAGIEERLAEGTVTPEDAEVMRELYPARMAEIVRLVMERLPTLRGTLPYRRRLALSIFTGVPVDGSMEPRILAQLQAMYAGEPGTEGGTQAPRPRPAFGSVTKPEPTAAQRRAG